MIGPRPRRSERERVGGHIRASHARDATVMDTDRSENSLRMNEELGSYDRVRLVTANEQLFCHFRRWAGGELKSGSWTSTAYFPSALVVVTTPRPWRFLVAFCEQREHEVAPLLLLKNVVPLYDVPGASETNALAADAWIGIRRAVLLYNPGLGGCLKLFESRSSLLEGKPLP